MSTSPKSIVSAIRRLGSEDSKERTRARETLEAIGAPATWHLIQAVYSPGEKTRHEALKALATVADPAAADLFVELLDDEDSDCRWLAAQGLAALGEHGLQRALELLIEYPKTEHLLRALHHALSEVEKSDFSGIVAPVLYAFQGAAPEAQLPTAAYEALNELRRAGHARSDHNTPTAR